MKKQTISVTVDAVVFKKEKAKTFILLISRKNPPYQNQWALPGGFVEDDEDLETAAKRELKKKQELNLHLVNSYTLLENLTGIPGGGRFQLLLLVLQQNQINPKLQMTQKRQNGFRLWTYRNWPLTIRKLLIKL